MRKLRTRRAELCRLQVNDIDSERMVIHIYKRKAVMIAMSH
jgi:integrase